MKKVFIQKHLAYSVLLLLFLSILPVSSLMGDSSTAGEAVKQTETTETSETDSNGVAGDAGEEEAGDVKIMNSMQDIELIRQLMNNLRQDIENSKENSSINSERLQQFDNAISLIDSKLQETYSSLDDSRTNIKSNIENIDKLGKDFNQVSSNLRANSADLNEQKSLIEDNSIRLYELLIKINEQTQILDSITTGLSSEEDSESLRLLKEESNENLNRLWLLLSTVLVFFAPLAFVLSAHANASTPQADGTRQHQGMVLVCLGVFLGYFILGFGLMYGITSSGWIGIPSHLFEALPENIATQHNFSEFVLYKTGFAMLAALIVYVSVASQLTSARHMILALFVGALLIPIYGHWVNASYYIPTNKGWLETTGFIDQAGAITINTVAGWFAFIIAWKMGKSEPTVATKEAKEEPVYSASATLLLWLSYFGFTTGSLPISDDQIASVILNVGLAASVGGLTAFLHYLFFHTNKEISIARGLGGYVSGLVAIAACAQSVTFAEAAVIGAVAGLLQNLAYGIIRKYFLQHAWQSRAAYLVAIHGVAGIWGALCYSLLGTAGNFDTPNLLQLGTQAQGIAVAIIYSIIMARVALVFLLYRKNKSKAHKQAPA